MENKKHEDGSNESLTINDVDYSNPKNWVYFDKTPKKEVDIFLVYPTVSDEYCDKDKPFVRLSCLDTRNKVDEWFDKNKSLFGSKFNIYAPLYRQLNGLMLESLNYEGFESYVNQTPRSDVFAAFDYFLKNINKNQRPFILHGQSQGSLLVSECASLFLGSEQYLKYNKNHVATYAIGCSITQSNIARNKNLKFAESFDDTGVILSWNNALQSEIDSGKYKQFLTWSPGALTINPISWVSTEEYAPASKNKASKIECKDGSYKMVKSYLGAKVDNKHGFLVCNPPGEVEEDELSTIGSLHKYDTFYFHDSIKSNMDDRITAFNNKVNK